MSERYFCKMDVTIILKNGTSHVIPVQNLDNVQRVFQNDILDIRYPQPEIQTISAKPASRAEIQTVELPAVTAVPEKTKRPYNRKKINN